MLDVPGVLALQHLPGTWPWREQWQVRRCWSGEELERLRMTAVSQLLGLSSRGHARHSPAAATWLAHTCLEAKKKGKGRM